MPQELDQEWHSIGVQSKFKEDNLHPRFLCEPRRIWRSEFSPTGGTHTHARPRDRLPITPREVGRPQESAVASQVANLRTPRESLRGLELVPGSPHTGRRSACWIGAADAHRAGCTEYWHAQLRCPEAVVVVGIGVRERSVNRPDDVPGAPWDQNHVAVEGIRALDLIGLRHG